MKLSDKTILITGGSSGIGLELARQLLSRGNTVLVTGRDEEKLAAALRALPGLHAFESDASDPTAIAALHQNVLAQFPALDALVNNAGIMQQRVRLFDSPRRWSSASNYARTSHRKHLCMGHRVRGIVLRGPRQPVLA